MIEHMKRVLGNAKAGTRVVYNVNSSPLDLPTPDDSSLTDSFFPGRVMLIQELLYADDCVLYAETEGELQALVTAYNIAARDFGQEVSQT